MLIYCRSCCKEKESHEFNKSSKHKSGLQTYCRACQKQHYQTNKLAHIANVSIRKQRIKKDSQNYIWNYLSSHPCVDCSENDPIVLEFDHVDRDEKEFNISDMVTYPLHRIMKEIEKCEVRCANCHKRRHAKESKTWRWSYFNT